MSNNKVGLRGRFNHYNKDSSVTSECSCGGCFTDNIQLEYNVVYQVNSPNGMLLKLSNGDLIWVKEFALARKHDEQKVEGSPFNNTGT